MDWVGALAGVLILLAAIQLYREWADIDPAQRRGNILLIVGLSISVVAPWLLDALGASPILSLVVRVTGFVFVLGAAYLILG
ncbi:MAG: hypothetical protein ABEI31_06390 [Halodesulfurarchaeum sp.]